jgi:hypothetical protein
VEVHDLLEVGEVGITNERVREDRG